MNCCKYLCIDCRGGNTKGRWESGVEGRERPHAILPSWKKQVRVLCRRCRRVLLLRHLPFQLGERKKRRNLWERRARGTDKEGNKMENPSYGPLVNRKWLILLTYIICQYPWHMHGKIYHPPPSSFPSSMSWPTVINLAAPPTVIGRAIDITSTDNWNDAGNALSKIGGQGRIGKKFLAQINREWEHNNLPW